MTEYAGKETEPNDLTDEELVTLYQSGERAALDKIIARYKNVVNATASRYFIPGAEKDDIIQEGLIGLYKAANDFSPSKGLYFKPYAAACVKNNIITAIKTAARKKNSPLNSYISLTKSTYDDGDESLLNIMALGEIQNPESIVIDRENVDGIEYTINRALSKFELEVLLEYLSGRSYREIASALNRDVKAVDNAIQRIKKKLTVLLGK
ncbi:MAG: RNA polymerase sporulation sigma factor SigH [Firmicutes bacterium]|nr:RNA polymerase sporulation sigma factor SigH [Bacillota bacterium]